MTASETPSFVFRNTSLTMRERFTPARLCSTFTRIRANFRLVRFSAAVSSRPGGFFLAHPTNACFVSWMPRIFSLKKA